ncbi:hypothetical protein [Flavobacterium salmonis]|uniref:hypothetical protein n=1 Tax=Flavobacterium salmonis TaxID=2654844 RepID=UPI001C608C60|nr:hypothetical protein [Flavobacterium salmonis]
MTEQGLIKVDAFQKTTVDNIFAGGDNTNYIPSVPTGNNTGVLLNKVMTEQDFSK